MTGFEASAESIVGNEANGVSHRFQRSVGRALMVPFSF
ncbi:hypothetical protein AOX55_00001701 [Sinorhizobium fredii CCBAU 25509]|nr:hypothetical protein AOX55_00001701 [Sinorhizobium fredii CCBAU 25509]